MTKQNKTALDLACEELAFYCSKPKRRCFMDEDFNMKNCSHDYPACQESIKQYFQEQADIPDGWDIVKEIYSQIKGQLKIWDKNDKWYDGLDFIKCWIDFTLENKYGIEVDDANDR